MNQYQHILENLYDNYFRNSSGHSKVTSSFWRTVRPQEVTIEKNQWNVKGWDFGDYRPLTFYNCITSLPQRLLLHYLLKKYHCSQPLIKAGKQIARRSGRIFSFDCVKQIISLHVISQILDSKSFKTVCVIGDGYGFLSSFIKLIFPHIKVVSVNLGRTLFFDVLFSQKCFSEHTPLLLKEKNDLSDLTFIEAENYRLLEGLPIDLFINIASMQEMDLAVINNYFQYMRLSSQTPCYFYCCNRLAKKLPDGTLIEFMKYPWQDSVILLDEICPWYQKYPSSKPPFWLPFDGVIQHRLARLK